MPRKLGYARSAEAKAIALAEETALLAHWLQYDILSWPVPTTRPAAICLTSWRRSWSPAGESACPHQIKPVRTMLENQGDNLLAFTVQLDRDLENLARKTGRSVWLPPGRSWRCNTYRCGTRSGGLCVAALRETLRGRYHGVCADVRELSDRVVRASSLVENLNSRLRTYFFLRRQWGRTT